MKDTKSGSCLVTGATGFIGRHVVDQMLLAGNAVRILTRGDRPIPQSWLDQIEVVHGELNDSKALQKAVSGCEYVFHLAAELRDHTKMDRVNIEGTRCLLEMCNQSRVHKFIHLSSVGIMGANREGDVDETEPCRPKNHYERSKYAAEKLVLAWCNDADNKAIIIRPTNVFGDGLRNGSDSMPPWLQAIQKGRFVYFGRHAISNYVYVKDVADVCCGATRFSGTGIFIINDPCMLEDFVSAAAEALGVPAPKVSIPLPLAYVAAMAFQGTSWLIRRRSPLTVSRVRALSIRTRYLSNRIYAVWGWWPAIGYKVGLQRTVNWYRKIGLV
jgi:nucleoside-diphosphate-sugar epimerase